MIPSIAFDTRNLSRAADAARAVRAMRAATAFPAVAADMPEKHAPALVPGPPSTTRACRYPSASLAGAAIVCVAVLLGSGGLALGQVPGVGPGVFVGPPPAVNPL